MLTSHPWTPPYGGAGATCGKADEGSLHTWPVQVLHFRPLAAIFAQKDNGSEIGSECSGSSEPSSDLLSSNDSDQDPWELLKQGRSLTNHHSYVLEYQAFQPVVALPAARHAMPSQYAIKEDGTASGGLRAASMVIACMQQALSKHSTAGLQQQLLYQFSCSLQPPAPGPAPTAASQLEVGILPAVCLFSNGSRCSSSRIAWEAAAGAARSIRQELQLGGEAYSCQTDGGLSFVPQLVRHVHESALRELYKQPHQHQPHQLHQQQQLQQQQQQQQCGKAPAQTLPLHSGLVAISGGLGALGLLIAQWLVQQGVQHILLLGRSARTSSAASQQLRQVWQGPAQATMAACDAGCAEDMAAVLAPASRPVHLPPLSAVLHAGGVLADATLRNQSLAGLRKVMGAKVAGLPHLLGAAQLQPGAHHVLFSSVASLLGSPGQANYSAANAALDAAASAWQRTGLPAVSMQWGAWAGGGMAAGDAITAARVERSGMSLIQPEQGLLALEGALVSTGAGSAAPVLAAVPFIWPAFLRLAQPSRGNAGPHRHLATPSLFSEFEHLCSTPQRTSLTASSTQARGPGEKQVEDSEALRRKIDAAVRETARGVLGREDVGAEEPLMSAGLDSLGAVELRNSLEGSLQLQLPTTLVFDYPTISSLQQFLVAKASEQQQQQLQQRPQGQAWIKGRSKVVTSAAKLPPLVSGSHQQPRSAILQVGAIVQRAPPVPWVPGSVAADQAPADACTAAVAGMPGDTVACVPLERWDIETEGALKGHPKASRAMEARFGAFLPDAALFDMQAFGISAAEAMLMDPQQRLLLECTAEAMAAAPLLEGVQDNFSTSAVNESMGTYIGAASSDYGSVVKKHTHAGAFHATANALSVTAGRLSYVFNLQGPSLSVDTACSSALVAMHLGMCAVSSSHVAAAVVGGVHVQAAPTSTSYVAAASMLSPQGRCMVLDENADGYVRGEGAAVLTIQAYQPQDGPSPRPPLALLLAEGSAVNQDARSSALTAPNGVAQQRVIRAALEASGVSATDVDLLSMHGTGTALGDPVELAALSAVQQEA